MPKTDAQLRKEIELYWPGGSGGGGRRRGPSKVGAVVRPHARTSPRCTRCSQYHTTEEHDRHARGGTAKRAQAERAPKKRAKAKRPPEKSTRSRAPREPLSDAQKVNLVMKAVRGAPRQDRHSGGVYVASAWRRAGKRLGMTLEEFKRWLVKRNAEQALTLVRVDLVDTADPRKLEESYIYDMGATFDIIQDPHHRDRFVRY